MPNIADTPCNSQPSRRVRTDADVSAESAFTRPELTRGGLSLSNLRPRSPAISNPMAFALQPLQHAMPRSHVELQFVLGPRFNEFGQFVAMPGPSLQQRQGTHVVTTKRYKPVRNTLNCSKKSLDIRESSTPRGWSASATASSGY